MSGTARRVASLIPSGTEIVSALGMADVLVGRSHCCDYPPEVGELPILCEPKVDPGRPSHEIDRTVRGLMQDGLSVYRVLVDRVRSVEPDLIVTQDHCDACAVSLGDVQEAVHCLGMPDTRICSLNPHDLNGVLDDVRAVGAALGVHERGEALAASMAAEFRSIAESTSAATRRPTIALVEWLAPPMVAGGWIPELARIAGAEPVIVDRPGHFVEASWAEIGAADPDIVVFLPCGFDVDRGLRELDAPEVRGPAAELAGGAPGGAFVVDGDALFNRPGPRLVESARLLAALIDPARFPGVLEGMEDAWVAWPEPGQSRTISSPSGRAYRASTVL